MESNFDITNRKKKKYEIFANTPTIRVITTITTI